MSDHESEKSKKFEKSPSKEVSDWGFLRNFDEDTDFV